MSRINAINHQEAQGRTRELLDGVKTKLGRVPNLLATLAVSPAALEGYVSLSGAVAGGALSAQDRERIALAVAQQNGCEYCLAAHSALGKMAGLNPKELVDSRHGHSDDPASGALLSFVRSALDNRGRVGDDEVAEAREAGLTDEQLAEAIANIALNVFTNYFNNFVETQVDFPAAPELASHAGACASGACSA